MYDKVLEALQTLGVTVEFQEYTGDEDEYIIFDIYLGKDSEYYEDKATNEIIYITISYYHKSKTGIKKYKKIKEAMRKYGFFLEDSKTLVKTNEYYGKNFDFEFKEDIEEDEEI